MKIFQIIFDGSRMDVLIKVFFGLINFIGGLRKRSKVSFTIFSYNGFKKTIYYLQLPFDLSIYFCNLLLGSFVKRIFNSVASGKV